MTSSTDKLPVHDTNNINLQPSLKKGLRKCSSEINLMSLTNQKNQKVKEYEIIKELGRGAYGTVHLARRDKDKKKVAMKVLDKMFLSKVNQYLYLFFRMKKQVTL